MGVVLANIAEAAEPHDRLMASRADTRSLVAATAEDVPPISCWADLDLMVLKALMADTLGGCVTCRDDEIVVVQLMRMLIDVASTLSSPMGKRRSDLA